MTVINPKSISGITSITLPSGGDNVLTIHTNDGTERFRIDSSGNVKVGSAATISPDGDVFFTGVTTATTFTGSGANLTNLPAANLTGTLPAISGANLTGIAATDNVRTGILDVAGISTFRNTVNIGAAVTISESGIEASGIGITVANINNGHIGGRRNMIINGDMTLAQRGSTISASSYTTAAYGACDRWKLEANNTDQAAFVVSQESDVPTGSGFSRSLKIATSTAETSLDSNEILHVSQPIEAQNLQHLKNGTSSALPITLSFWVKSYQTGTYVVTVYKADNTNRQISATYTISDSNTWEFKTMTFPGDTSGGGINSDNGAGLQIYWLLTAGSNFTGTTNTSWANYADGGFANGQSVNIMSSTDNYYYLTGVQLEIGTQATPFEHITVAETKRLCMRYFERIDNGYNTGVNNYYYFGAGYFEEDTNLRGFIAYKEQKRATPTITFSAASTFNAINTASMPAGNSIGTQYINTVNTGYTFVSNSVSGRDGQGGLLVANNTDDAYLLVDAEL